MYPYAKYEVSYEPDSRQSKVYYSMDDVHDDNSCRDTEDALKPKAQTTTGAHRQHKSDTSLCYPKKSSPNVRANNITSSAESVGNREVLPMLVFAPEVSYVQQPVRVHLVAYNGAAELNEKLETIYYCSQSDDNLTKQSHVCAAKPVPQEEKVAAGAAVAPTPAPAASVGIEDKKSSVGRIVFSRAAPAATNTTQSCCSSASSVSTTTSKSDKLVAGRRWARLLHMFHHNDNKGASSVTSSTEDEPTVNIEDEEVEECGLGGSYSRSSLLNRRHRLERLLKGARRIRGRKLYEVHNGRFEI